MTASELGLRAGCPWGMRKYGTRPHRKEFGLYIWWGLQLEAPVCSFHGRTFTAGYGESYDVDQVGWLLLLPQSHCPAHLAWVWAFLCCPLTTCYAPHHLLLGQGISLPPKAWFGKQYGGMDKAWILGSGRLGFQILILPFGSLDQLLKLSGLNYLQNWDNNTDLLKVMRHYFIPIELAKMRKNKNNDCWWKYE